MLHLVSFGWYNTLMFASPETIIATLLLEEGNVVADFGAGSGAFTIAAAKALNGSGNVYAIDVQKDLLARLEHTCQDFHVANVSYVWGNIEKQGGTKLRDGSVDVVIVSNVLFQITEKKTVIEEAKRILKHNGKLLLIDWTASFKNLGPTPEQVFPELEAHKMIEGMAFSFEKNIDAGNFHYGLIFRKGLYYNPTVQEKAMKRL